MHSCASTVSSSVLSAVAVALRQRATSPSHPGAGGAGCFDGFQEVGVTWLFLSLSKILLASGRIDREEAAQGQGARSLRCGAVMGAVETGMVWRQGWRGGKGQRCAQPSPERGPGLGLQLGSDGAGTPALAAPCRAHTDLKVASLCQMLPKARRMAQESPQPCPRKGRGPGDREKQAEPRRSPGALVHAMPLPAALPVPFMHNPKAGPPMLAAA